MAVIQSLSSAPSVSDKNELSKARLTPETVAAMWTAILCVQAGDFLNNCLTAIWPSFANFPNHLPESAGITSAGLLCFVSALLRRVVGCATD